MFNLSEISIDEIETGVMSILYANIDKKFTQYTLFNKLLEDKYDGQYTNVVHSNFKSKFLLVMRTIGSKYDDIIVEKKDGICYIVCQSSKKDMKENHLYMEYIAKPVEFEKSDIANMFDYIYDNNMIEHMNWTELDLIDGNSIYHELVLNNNDRLVKKLLDENKFNFEIKNNKNQTPMDLINSQSMSKLIIDEFAKKIIVLREKYNIEKYNVEQLVVNYHNKICQYETEEYKNKIISETSLYDIIEKKTNKYYYVIKAYLFSIIVCYLAMRIIF